jgi:DNA-binding MarR family transcriptional regulator
MTQTTARPRGTPRVPGTPGTPGVKDAPDVPDALGGAVAPSPDDPRLRAWIAFLQAYAVVTRRLEAELNAERGLSLADYDALVQLAIADERRLRMSELAERVVLSRSGVSRLVDRLEADGLVGRRACPTDARGSWAELTPAGLDRLRHAAPVHLRGVEAHFLSPIAEEDREGLVRALEAVVRGLQPADSGIPPSCATVAEALEP